jgi:predicted nuclease with TOPRIM domain
VKDKLSKLELYVNEVESELESNKKQLLGMHEKEKELISQVDLLSKKFVEKSKEFEILVINQIIYFITDRQNNIIIFSNNFLFVY